MPWALSHRTGQPIGGRNGDVGKLFAHCRQLVVSSTAPYTSIPTSPGRHHIINDRNISDSVSVVLGAYISTPLTTSDSKCALNARARNGMWLLFHREEMAGNPFEIRVSSVQMCPAECHISILQFAVCRPYSLHFAQPANFENIFWFNIVGVKWAVATPNARCIQREQFTLNAIPNSMRYSSALSALIKVNLSGLLFFICADERR